MKEAPGDCLRFFCASGTFSGCRRCWLSGLVVGVLAWVLIFIGMTVLGAQGGGAVLEVLWGDG
jgi:hypothetical protein